MQEYEINNETLAIIAIGENKSKIIEENNEFYMNRSVKKIINDSCCFFGSSYEGRVEGSKKLTGITHKVPVIIEESRKIIFFPIKSPRLSSCIWLSYNNILKYRKINKRKTLILFSCGKQLELNISYNIIDNQILRSTRLESIFNKRIENYKKNI